MFAIRLFIILLIVSMNLKCVASRTSVEIPAATTLNENSLSSKADHGESKQVLTSQERIHYLFSRIDSNNCSIIYIDNNIIKEDVRSIIPLLDEEGMYKYWPWLYTAACMKFSTKQELSALLEYSRNVTIPITIDSEYGDFIFRNKIDALSCIGISAYPERLIVLEELASVAGAKKHLSQWLESERAQSAFEYKSDVLAAVMGSAMDGLAYVDSREADSILEQKFSEAIAILACLQAENTDCGDPEFILLLPHLKAHYVIALATRDCIRKHGIPYFLESKNWGSHTPRATSEFSLPYFKKWTDYDGSLKGVR